MSPRDLAIAVLLLAAFPARAEEYTPRQRARLTPIVEVVRKSRDAVVNIAATSVVTVRDSFYSMFDMPRSREVKTNSLGSGSVIHPDGYILTNAHVVGHANELKVIFADGTSLPADVVATLQKNDLAVIRVHPAHPLTALKLGRSDDLMVGESVIAIGNPLGLKHTVTSGIVSAVGRELRESDDSPIFHDVIQTDAAINPGSSGGPMMNILGELIGVNTAIRTDAQNVGFAIPVDRVRELLPQLLSIQTRGRIKFGVAWGQEVESPVRGVMIGKVEPGSPADKAKLTAGQIVTDIGSSPASSLVNVLVAVLEQPYGKAFPVRVADSAGAHEVAVTFEAIPIPDGSVLAWKHFGMTLEKMSAEMLRKYALKSPVGAIVSKVAPNSPAEAAGIEAGDFVVQIDRYPTRDVDMAAELLEQVHRGDSISFVVAGVRNGEVFRSPVVMQAN